MLANLEPFISAKAKYIVKNVGSKSADSQKF